MNLKRLGIYVLVGLILGGFLYVKGCLAGRKAIPSTAPAALKPTDKEQILIDPIHHKITTVTHTGTSVTTLPDHPSTITEHTDGSVSVNIPQFGYEQQPFIGYGFSNQWKLMAGCDLAYWKRLDFGVGLDFTPYHPFDTMRVAALVSYTIWSNTRASLGVEHTGMIVGMLTVRL